MKQPGPTQIAKRRAITPDLYLGKTGTFTGFRISDNKLVDVEGTIEEIIDASWALLTIRTNDGIRRIRIA